MGADLAVIVTARNEADRLGATLRALRTTFPQADLWVADDGSEDATAHVALQEGARLVQAPRPLGKGGAATLADADLGDSAGKLGRLIDAVSDAGDASSAADLAIAMFASRVGGGFGIAV